MKAKSSLHPDQPRDGSIRTLAPQVPIGMARPFPHVALAIAEIQHDNSVVWQLVDVSDVANFMVTRKQKRPHVAVARHCELAFSYQRVHWRGQLRVDGRVRKQCAEQICGLVYVIVYRK